MTLIRADDSATTRRPHGVLYVVHQDGRQDEHDILTCAHCQYTWVVLPGSGRRRGWCRQCNGPLCGKQPCMAACVPYERMIERLEAAR